MAGLRLNTLAQKAESIGSSRTEVLMLIYTAGPYSASAGAGTVLDNIGRSAEIAARLWDMGYTVICPHMNTAGFENLTSLSNKEFVDRDLEIVERCSGIVMLPRWQQSRGAVRELEHARKHGLQVWMWPAVPVLGAQKNRRTVKPNLWERIKTWWATPNSGKMYY